MADDDNLRALLPEAPPPDPARRNAAIGAALRRFDVQAGNGPGADAGTGERRGGRVAVPVLASLVLVAMLTVPVLLSNDRRFALERSPGMRSEANMAADVVEGVTTLDIPETATPPAARSGGADADVAPAMEGAGPILASRQADLPEMPSAAPPAIAVPAPPPPPPAPAAPAALVADEAAGAALAVAGADAEDGGRSIVVTGARRSPAARPPELSREVTRSLLACTVLDPRSNIRRCPPRADAGTRDASSEADSYVAEGLTRAWRGDERAALRAFNRAAVSDPGIAAAYLNRGLLRRERGQSAAALADFTRAIAADPDDARGYYFRSLLLRRMGETERADQDLERVREIAGE